MNGHQAGDLHHGSLSAERGEGFGSGGVKCVSNTELSCLQQITLVRLYVFTGFILNKNEFGGHIGMYSLWGEEREA